MNARPRRFCILLIGLAAPALPGCYEHVVGAKGMGAQGVSIAEPNAPKGSVTQTTTQKRTLRLKDTTSR